MSATLSKLVKQLYDRQIATKRISALTGGLRNLDNIIITNAGSAYTSAPTVGFSGGGGSGAAATATIANGVIVDVTVTNAGTGYTGTPAVTFSGGGGSGAAATAIMAANTLDAISTTGITAGEMIALLSLSGVAYIYQLAAGTDVETSPSVIRPDDYDPGTNAKVWKLQGQYVNALSILDASDVTLGTSTGTRLGTAVSQKLGFWGATPVVQQASASQAAVTLGNTDGEIAALTFSATPTQAECEALRDKCEELADDVRALSTLLHALRTAGMNTGIWKGSA